MSKEIMNFCKIWVAGVVIILTLFALGKLGTIVFREPLVTRVQLWHRCMQDSGDNAGAECAYVLTNKAIIHE